MAPQQQHPTSGAPHPVLHMPSVGAIESAQQRAAEAHQHGGVQQQQQQQPPPAQHSQGAEHAHQQHMQVSTCGEALCK